MEAHDLWDQQIKKTDESENISNNIWDVQYSPDNGYLFAVTGNAMIIFDAQSGEVCNTNVGLHKGNIYSISISKDGRLIATGGADNVVILWNGTNIEAEKKFKMSGSIQCLSFNPITNLLFVGTKKDVGLFNPDAQTKPLERTNAKSPIKTGEWSPDGRYIAYGTENAQVHLKDTNFEKKKMIVKLAAVTCLAWSPLTLDHPDLLLAIACVDQTISFHDEEGEQFGFERKCKMEIYSISWFSNGNYFLAAGSHNIVCVYSREGSLLKELVQTEDWIWGVTVNSVLNQFAIGTNDGEVRSYMLDFKDPKGFSDEKFATRVGLTEVLITDVNTDKKARFRCKELVRHISLFETLLAVELTSRVLVYEETPLIEEGPNSKQLGFSYSSIGKFGKKLQSDFFLLASENFISVKENKIKSYSFETQRVTNEWVMGTKVTYVKLLPGPSKAESLLVGTEAGKVMRVMLNNPFPSKIIDHGVEIKSLDMSLMKKLLGVVDTKKGFSLYDIAQKKPLITELKIEYCCFNTEFDQMFAFGGEGLVFVRTLDYPGISMKFKGEMVGFKGSKIKMVNGQNLNSLDLPLSSFMSYFVSKKDFKSAYKIASLGVPDQDMRSLGMAALKFRNFRIAKKAFTRVKEVGYLDLAIKYERIMGTDQFDEAELVVDILAYEKKFKKAISFLKKNKKIEKAIELCITMRQWSEALALVNQAKRDGSLKNSKYDIYKLLKMQAEGENAKGNWKAAVDLMVNSNEFTRAIEILIKNDQEDLVVKHMRRLNKKQDQETLKTCAAFFMEKGNHQAGKEALLKLGNKHELMKLHVSLDKWDEALMLADSDADLRKIMLLPYAEYLAKNNKFEEAQTYYKEAGRADLSMEIMHRLSNINLVQKNYKEAAHFYWILAKENLKNVNSIKAATPEDLEKIENFKKYIKFSEIFQAYEAIHDYILRPVDREKYPGYTKAIMNAAKTTLGYSHQEKLEFISMTYVNYVLAKTSLYLGGKKTARIAFEKLNQLVVPTDWMEDIELSSLKSRAQKKSATDLNWKCSRCDHSHVISQSNNCANCLHPIVISPLSFSEIPVVEFEVVGDLSHEQIMEYLSTTNENDAIQRKRTANKKKKDKLWDFNMEGKEGEKEEAQMNRIDVEAERKKERNMEEDTPFHDKIMQATDLQMGNPDYLPVKVDVETLWSMDMDDVFCVDYRKYHQDYPVKYYKKMDLDLDIILCSDCGKFFIADEFDLYYNQFGCCPFCKNKNLTF